MAIRVTAKELRVFSTKRPMGPILFQDLGLQPAKWCRENRWKPSFRSHFTRSIT